MSHPHKRRQHTQLMAPLAIGALCLGAALVGPAVADTASTPASRPTAGTQPEAPRVASIAPTGLRPFRTTSYWNKPLGRAPLDPHNRQYIRDSQIRRHTQGYLKLILGDWGLPAYRSGAGDPLYAISSSGHTVHIHIPRAARQMPTSDAALTVIDRATHQVVGLYGAHFSQGRWRVTGLSRYLYDSGGIAGGLPTGIKANFGHRGIPGSVQAVTRGEIRRGVIRHRLEVFWHETASRTPSGRSAYFPMTGSESGKSGVVPEGSVIRIRPAVNLKAMHLSRGAYIIARALQRYGAVVGDTAGSGNSLKLQAKVNWRGVLNRDSLRKIKWSDFVFVKGGYRP